ncbi:MAG: sulfurtransferase [Elusimicrobia bacterium]|nr:sulfurtransferase [Elusimicrobiota bacterium]
MTRKHAIAAVVAAVAAVGLLAVALASRAAPAAFRFEKLVSEARQRTRSISAGALRARIDAGERGFILIDVREDSEWAGGGLPGAVHLGRGILERDIEKTVSDAESEIILYCGAGARSVLAAESLQRMGYMNVYSLEGGARAWLDSSRVVKRADGH